MNPFNELGIRHDIVNAITELGFEKPTPIQESAIPVLLSGSNDFVGLAQTGTGKTAAFGLPSHAWFSNVFLFGVPGTFNL